MVPITVVAGGEWGGGKTKPPPPDIPVVCVSAEAAVDPADVTEAVAVVAAVAPRAKSKALPVLSRCVCRYWWCRRRLSRSQCCCCVVEELATPEAETTLDWRPGTAGDREEGICMYVVHIVWKILKQVIL